MRNHNHKQPSANPVWDSGTLRSKTDFLLMRVSLILFLGILSFFFFKVHQTGITGDEAVSYFTFSTSFKYAYTKYHKAGNHILYSIGTHLAHKLFPSYEHFVRIPSAVTGLIYMCCMVLIMIKKVKTRPILPAAVLMVLLNQFVFSYCFMARGYAFALGGIFLQIVFVLRLLERKIRFRSWWAAVLVLSFLNAFILGSMLTGLQITAAMNLCIVLASPFFYHDAPSRLKTMVLHLFSIALISGILCFAVYAGVFRHMRSTLTSEPYQGDPFFMYLKNLFYFRIFSANAPFNQFLFIAFLLLSGILIAAALLWNSKHKTGWNEKYRFLFGSFRGWIYSFTGLSLIGLFLYSVLFRLPLGYPRNQVFLIPLVLLCTVLAFDQVVVHCRQSAVKYTLITYGILLMLGMAWQNRPALYYAVGYQTVSKPLLKELQSIDSERIWQVSFDPKIKTIRPALLYYLPYGYRFKLADPQYTDVYICRISSRPKEGIELNRDFFRQFGCSVMVTSNFPTENIMIEYRKK